MAYTTIDDPSAYFHTRLYTGTGSSQAVTNNANAGDFQPDWVWIKCRSDAASHKIFDTSRLDGSNNPQLVLQTDATSADNDVGDSDFTSIDTNGFTVLGANATGASSRTYVAWQWKANGGTTSSNSSGSITSTVQASTTAGFSIVTYTGNSTGNATVGHGLGVTPDVIIVKNRSGTNGWRLMHQNLDSGKTLFLEATDAQTTDAARTDLTSSTLFTLTNDSAGINASSNNYIAYCFAEIQGYSKFGSYTGNANADGPFVYTGFKPAWLLIKETSGTEDWRLYDNKRSPFNVMDDQLFPNSNSSEATSSSYDLDFLSNGFKLRSSHGGYNTSGDTYIYIAFAESPFVSSEGVPTTAK